MVDAAHDLGAAIFVASGNDGIQGQQKAPAHSSKVLTVGAVDLTNLTHTASYQASGPTPDGRIKPELQAPSGIVTAYNGCGGEENWCAESNNGIWTIDGTSISTPIVTGVAYLLKQQLISFGILTPEPGHIYSWLLTLGNGLQTTNTTGAGLLSLGWRQCWFMWQTLAANQYTQTSFTIDSQSDTYASKRMDVVVWWPEPSSQTVRNQVSLKLSSPQGVLLAQANASNQVWQKIVYLQPENAQLPNGTYNIRIDVGTLQPTANSVRVFLTFSSTLKTFFCFFYSHHFTQDFLIFSSDFINK
jgi:subtilisin family serine protease